MSFDWVELLDDAGGRSEDVITIMLDIRGFTGFCRQEVDRNIATYITKLYKKILNDYFPDITFSKPMGDGLFLVQKYEEKTAEETVMTLVDSCLKLIDNFHNLIDDDVMIIFSTPEKIGIGFVRGPACCIYNGDQIIDYSGKRLNHAARLVDKARPSGMIIDYASVIGIIPPELLEQFEEDAICLRGVAETTPIRILYQKNSVTIQESDRIPINEPKWQSQEYYFTGKEIKSFTKTYTFNFDRKPTNLDSICLSIDIPIYLNGKKIAKAADQMYYNLKDKELSYLEEGKISRLELDLDPTREFLEEKNIPDEEPFFLGIQYY